MTTVPARTLAAAAVCWMAASVPLFAQPPSLPTTAVLATLTINRDAVRAEVVKVLPDEVRATVRLYLDGKIQQWWARADGVGVVFVLQCASVEEARALTDQLPFSQKHMATFDYVALTPLSPLRVLLADPVAPKGDEQPGRR